jgi:hypothetical protein
MRAIALTIAVATALSLGACGGSDKNGNASNSTTTQTTATQPSAGSTGKSGKQKGKKSAQSGQGKTSGGSKGQTTKTQTTTQTQTSTTPSVPASAYKTAKNVCGTILPIVVQRQLRQGKTTKKKVAKQYSTGWPPDKRKQAYRGCLAGLSKYK